jgi:translation initiation factor IF-2
VAKILVQNGTLRTGDIIAAGTSYGKIRAMYNEKNQVVKEAGPSVPVLLLGLNSAPQAGDTFKTYKTDKEARAIVNKRSQLLREQGLRTQKHITLDELGRRIAVGDFKELNVIVKGDVDGSIEALSDEILKLSTTDVQVNVIHKSVGQVTESDVLLASASDAIIIAFQVRPSSGAKKLAEQEQVDIRVYSVIYSAIDDLKSAIAGMKAPEIKEQVVANLEVRETFRISKVGLVAGCYVMDGKIQRSSKVRVIRDGIVIHDNGRLGSLKRFKDDAKEVSAGLECGLNIESFNDIVVGDLIEAYEEIEVPVK